MKHEGYKTIVVPTDFSECSDVAVDHAVALAKRFGSRLRFVHVIHEMTAHLEGLEGPVFVEALADVHQEIERQAKGRMAELKKKSPGATTTIHHGNPTAEIVMEAEAQRADLIVMGTHGRTGLDRILLGSVAHQVMQKASCPVMVVKHPSTGNGGKKGRKKT
jgi:nucleotide-binding universal stress UspA family protein